MKIAVLGAGAWGTALAMQACRRHEVVLWARDADQARAMQQSRRNERYLPGFVLPDELVIRAGPPDQLLSWVADADLVIIATPMAALRGLLEQLAPLKTPVGWLCKGFENPVDTPFGLLAHELCSRIAPGLKAGALSGPSFAQEVAQGRPTALVAASADAGVRAALRDAFHGPSLRVYGNEDLVGVELAGALKNVLAIAAGFCDGLQLGLNARAALITRGLSEMTRLGVALGARAETFMGLAGVGDLVLTATGDLSRNRKVGLMLATGQGVPAIMASLGHVAEGVYCARTVLQRSQQAGVEMPITQAVVALLDGHIKPVDAVGMLMGRDPRSQE